MTTGARDAAPLLPIRVDGLCKTFPGAGRPVLDDVSFEIGRRGLYGLMGPSGSGKTTLLNLLAGFDRPDAGSIRFGAADPYAAGADGGLAFRRERVGFLFQDAALVPELPVLDNIALRGMIRNEPAPVRRARAGELLAGLGLGDLAGRRVAGLSAGEAARVALLRAVYGGPALVLADEPTGALDAESGCKLAALLRDLAAARELVVLLATHDERLLATLDQVFRLRDGKLCQSRVPGQG